MKYLELIKGQFTADHEARAKQQEPYVAYSEEAGGVMYTFIPKPEQPSLYEAVDLGLPSGLKWANMNVGATSPEDTGLYFQWGDTVGYTKEQVEAGEKVFDWNNYWDTTDGGSTFNKYNKEGGLTQLDSVDDAATVHMGSEWRMPTIDEITELIDNTTPTFIDIQGNEFTQEEVQNGAISEMNLKGIRLTGTNGNSIFIPAAGICDETMLSEVGYSGCLWSSSLSEYDSMSGRSLYFNYDGNLYDRDDLRYYGLSVRGIKA